MHVDISGNEIKVGSYIAYAALWDRSATMKFGKVTELCERKPRYGGLEKVTNTLRVVSVDRSWKNVWELQNNGKVITLSFLDRLIVIPENFVHPDALKLLNSGV